MEPAKPQILVAPLNWGLGHATRSIPVIRRLLDRGFGVTVASDGLALELLRREFPQLESWELPGYGVHYRKPVLISLIKQIPGIQKVIREEHQLILDRAKRNRFRAIISDNRYGIWHPDIPSILITHQVQLPIGQWTTKLINPWLRSYFRPYREIWVPDFAPPHHLTGYMTETNDPRIHAIGPLSRFTKSDLPQDIELLVLLSGPEPARTRWENFFLQEEVRLPYRKMVLLRGLPGADPDAIPSTDRLTILPHLPAEALNNLMARSKAIICRAGYSTIMDLMILEKTAIMVPTPGQPEQEYIAHRLQIKNLAVIRQSELFSIQEAIASLELCQPWPQGQWISWEKRLDNLLATR
ncbi:MAG TPA: glycosyltransferase [Saprospiraceae bacterium]|nr:glycosyltransferase [Lewinellaceae bacterium]HPG08930.1 glycosyltransferase [Saprospiraceae bacterium]HPQ99434.1 glycosyltransferase [Saprospiraceae bacterium]HRV86670.1 glycosyltransferase [Saprospiraceae bacterium]